METKKKKLLIKKLNFASPLLQNVLCAKANMNTNNNKNIK